LDDTQPVSPDKIGFAGIAFAGYPDKSTALVFKCWLLVAHWNDGLWALSVGLWTRN